MQLPQFKLEKYLEQYEFKAPYLLCASDSETLSLKELLSWADVDALTLWENLRLGYTHVEGFPLLRKEIAKLYQNIPEKGIGTFAGAEEGIFTVMNVLLRPKDHVIVPVPCYQSLMTIPKELGAEVTPVPLKERGGGWYFDPADLAKVVRPNTRMIVINFPHNPTGAHIDRMTLQEVVDIAKGVGAYLFSDEAYRFSEHRSEVSLPAAADLYEKGISVGIVSKTFGLAGLRIGWVAIQDAELLQSFLEYKHYLSICNSAPSEILALIALRSKEKILTRNLGIIRKNVAELERFFEKYSKIFSWKKPTAGPIAFPKLLAPIPVQEFTEDLITKEGVLLMPSKIYDYPGNYFRIGFGRKDMPDALSRLEHYVRYHFRDRLDER